LIKGENDLIIYSNNGYRKIFDRYKNNDSVKDITVLKGGFKKGYTVCRKLTKFY